MLNIKFYVNDTTQNINNAKSRIIDAIPTASYARIHDETSTSFVLRLYDEKDRGETVNLEINANDIMVVDKYKMTEEK